MKIVRAWDDLLYSAVRSEDHTLDRVRCTSTVVGGGAVYSEEGIGAGGVIRDSVYPMFSSAIAPRLELLSEPPTRRRHRLMLSGLTSALTVGQSDVSVLVDAEAAAIGGAWAALDASLVADGPLDWVLVQVAGRSNPLPDAAFLKVLHHRVDRHWTGTVVGRGAVRGDTIGG